MTQILAVKLKRDPGKEDAFLCFVHPHTLKKMCKSLSI